MAYKHPRIYFPNLPGEGQIVITGEKYIHLARSVRSKPGDIFQLFDGDGLFADAEIESIDSESISAKIIKTRNVNNIPDVKLTLAFGLIPPDPMKTLIAGATQLGVVSFIPFVSELNDIKISEEKSDKTLDRWWRIITENSAVASRSHLAEIIKPVDFNGLLSIASTYKTKLVFWEEGGFHWREFLPMAEGDVIAVIGPRGGLSEGEVDQLKSNGFIILSFGELVLKSEIAALSACARIIGH